MRKFPPAYSEMRKIRKIVCFFHKDKFIQLEGHLVSICPSCYFDVNMPSVL